MFNSHSITSWLLVCFFALGSSCHAQDEDSSDSSPPKKNKVEMLQCRVKVVDPDGFAVEDATVLCTGMRSKEERSSHWGWPEKSCGKAARINTNADGVAVMSYPKMISEGHTTGQMTWSVEHPDFVKYCADHSVDGNPAELRLERGFRIALTAKDTTTGEYLKENLHAVTSFEGGGEWELKKNGTFVSGVMKKQEGIMRVACFRDGAPTLFSDEIKLEPGDKSRLLLRDVELSVGCRVEGKLDDSVTRPVSNGYVIASMVKRPNPKTWNSLRWTDEAKISEDGTFVFESLPNDETIQMIPICDGFSPAKPKLEDVLAALPTNNPDQIKWSLGAYTVTPQMVKTNGETAQAELLMNKAFSVTVKVVDQNGEPIKDVAVATNPNQYWFHGGSQILGSSYTTRKMWKMKKDGEDLTSYYRWKRHAYMKKTDENGVACLENMPSGAFHRIGVYEEDWEMAIDPKSGDREKRVKVHDKDRAITIKMYPKGKSPQNDHGAVLEAITIWWNKFMEPVE